MLAIAVAELGTAIVVVKRPGKFIEYRSRINAFNILIAVLESNMLSGVLHFCSVGYCKPAGSPVFWLAQVIVPSTPWVVLHAILFHLPISSAILVNGVRICIFKLV